MLHVPREKPATVIIWEPVHHNPSRFQPLGNYTIQILDDFVLIPKLAIGGAIQQTSSNDLLLQLDNGFLCEHSHQANHSYSQIFDRATTFLKTAKPSIHTDLLEAHITAALEAQRATMISSWDQLCKQQTEFDHFRRWAVATFPDSASRLLASEYGLHVRLVGEAIMVSRCTPINMYTVHWSRQYNTTCYNLFPVIIPRNSSLLFVDFSTRELKPYSNVISCQSRPEFTVVEDLAGSLWHILANGTLFRSVASDTLYPHPSFRLPKLRGFNSKLVQPQSVSLDRLFLLEIVTNNYGTFQEIGQFADNNGGDFFTGLGQVLGRTISALGTGGSKLLDAAGRSVNTALHGIGDAGVKVATGMTQSAGSLTEKGGHAIRDVEHGTVSLSHSIFGSIGGAILWGVVVLVIAYLLYS
eukprot:gene14655-16173_t